MLDSFNHMTLKLLKNCIFWRENVKILPSFTQRYNGRHNVSRKSVNHLWFIDFIAWCYFTSRRDVM